MGIVRARKSSGTCPICGGKVGPGKTTFTADLGESVVVVRNVTARICAQCGEEWIDDKTARKLESIGEEARARRRQLEVVAM